MFSWLLPSEKCPCSGDREARLLWGCHPAWSQGQDEGVGNAVDQHRVSLQMQLLPRDSPVTGDINRGEKKLLFSEKEG